MNAPPPLSQLRKGRHPGAESYEEILDQDTRPVPAFLREQHVPELPLEGVPVERYFDREFFQKEVQHVWLKCWQWACREEDIPNVGDTEIYDVVGKSLLICRTKPDEIRAFYNSCPHRGRKLATLPGCKSEFRCPYHGLSWNTDGVLKNNHIAWDFPQWEGGKMDLPEAKVETWGGFVFINFDLNARPLMDYLGPLAKDFERYELHNRHKIIHVQKPVRCNWKALAEAFMESHHSVTTHPQILPFLADVNSQYDLLNDYVSRHFSAQGVASPLLADQNLTAEQIIAAMTGQATSRRQVGEAGAVPEGMTARQFAAEQGRQALSASDGWDYSDKSDAEMLDALLYNLWPNMSFWAGFPPNLVYRWRPRGLDPEVGIMDVVMLKRAPKDAPRPPPVPVHELGIDEPWSAAEELGGLAGIFEQDMGNLPYVQEGLHASGTGVVHFARYSEMRIRQLHLLIDRWIAAGEAGS